jgi:hypothetical protein
MNVTVVVVDLTASHQQSARFCRLLRHQRAVSWRGCT